MKKMKTNGKKQVNIETRPTKKKSLRLRVKLIMIFVSVMIIPVVLLTVIAWNQIMSLGFLLRDISVSDATTALNDGARDNLERMTTDTASSVAEFLYHRDQDVLLLANLMPSDDAYMIFSENRNSKLMTMGEWVIADDGMSWVEVDPFVFDGTLDVSSNRENNDVQLGSSFNYRPPEFFDHYQELFPLYDEITFINLDGQELFKYVNPGTTKVNYPLNPEKVNVSNRLNTYVKAETYWEELQKLKPGEVYVSDVIGAYVGTNYIGMYTPGVLKNNVPETHPNYALLQEIADLPPDEFMDMAKKQAFAGMENPFGQRFEGIVRWATPVLDFEGDIWGYVTIALNHDHIMEFVDFITPMVERYSVLSDAYDGNYAFIWDYKCRSIAHPRHHSIVGFNPLTGLPQVPWLEGSIMMERDFENGGFILDENRRPIPIPDANGETQPAVDTPFYLWYSSGGEQWLENNQAWNELSDSTAGLSWGEFYLTNRDDREMLPQFGERPLKNTFGNPVFDENGRQILDYQSRSKTPARLLTQSGFVGLDGRYLNNAPQCTGWMDLTEDGGSGSFYIYWSNIYKPTTAGAIPYYTGKYAPEVQGNSRGFAFVTIGSGIDDFTEPAVLMEGRLNEAISANSRENTMQLIIASLGVFTLILLVSVLVASSVTRNIKQLIAGLSRFRKGERHFRIHSKASDEFGELADSFDRMADSLEDSINAPLTITNLNHEIIYVNKHGMSVIGKDQDEILGTFYGDTSIYPANSPSDPIAALHDGREAEVLHREDSDHYYRGIANHLYDQNGNKTGYIITTSDVTEIEIARQKAEQASVAKTNFLSNMSHEIRTPLNAIIGMTSIGSASTDIDKKSYALTKIHDASKHLLGIINDILDVSKIEANKYTLSKAAFSLDEMLQRVVDVINFRVEQKHQKLTLHIDPNMPETLIGDDQRLAQVLTNLLSNSVKFTAEGGGIHLEVMLEDEQDGMCTLKVAVSDTGIGISKEQQERLFNSFEQAETSTSRRFGGTGLGLVICKSIVEMMDGKIWVESELGDGAIMTFTVRLACDRSGKKKLPNGVNAEAVRLLVVDNDARTKVFFEEMGFKFGFVCDVAKNSEDALAMIAGNEKYNICFVAWEQSEMNGIELTRFICKNNRDCKVVLMIAEADWNIHKESAVEAGVTAHLTKPLLASSVTDCINSLLYSTGYVEEIVEVQSADFEGHTILLVEDVEINREIVMALLEPTNLKIDCAENGIEAVAAFKAAPDKYDMIFMDIQMPEMDGFTATELIRDSGVERAKEIPIVAMTANAFKEDIEKCLESGMNGHLGKPLAFDMVIATLEEYLKGKKGSPTL
ncbi:MAG: response regulator [Oscillospiraceae bacterium]|jgi:signal transduction histidine kinase/DNA-binding response OmpR family regulator/HAMP domain-containing protein|nr:response regulator [Oscillospiraceae bacterium]